MVGRRRQRKRSERMVKRSGRRQRRTGRRRMKVLSFGYACEKDGKSRKASLEKDDRRWEG
jgi:hypothetical protein